MSRRTIPIVSPAAEAGDCGEAGAFALMVLGDSMAPEFVEGDVIIIEPEGVATDGAFVLAELDGELIFRQLVRTAAAWQLKALNPAYAGASIDDLAPVKGVIIQKSKPGRRRAAKRYVE